MSYIRKIRLEYYKVVYKVNTDVANSPDRNFDLSLWIAKAEKKSLEARTFDYAQEQARLDKIYFLKDKYWFLNFVRMRETNIPSKAKINEESVPLELADDEYIGEEVNALYDEAVGVIMLQRNRYSLGLSGIEEYLNLIWDSNTEKIFLRPVPSVNILEKVSQAYSYRKVTMRFADVKNKNLDSDDKKPFYAIYDSLKQYKTIVAEINFSIGYNKNDELDRETVKDTINDIMKNKDVISKAEIGMKREDDSKVELIDLFEDKMHDFIFVTLEKRMSLASEFVAGYMIEKYDEAKGAIINALRGN